MTVKIIPTPVTAEPLRTQETQLEGKTYVLTYDYSGREDKWYLSMADVNGNTLISAVKLVPNLNLLRTLTADEQPGGKLYLTTVDSLDPTLDTIDEAILFYQPLADL